ncbi:MAG TPA: condensation domain-containing protein, partial [Anaerolineales bacterium]|nr:condensation domain-containing protein [Anaerolineales bacterium]
MLKKYERRITPLERLFTRSPFSLVTMVVRIKGEITEELLTRAVAKVQQRHTLLRVRIKEDQVHIPWFTSEEVGEIPIDVVTRESDEDWINVHREASQVPFEFEKRPAIRFILVRGSDLSELIILCHHIICDGLSLAYLARDLMEHLGDPNREVEVLPDP